MISTAEASEPFCEVPTALVVTSVSEPNDAMRSLAAGCSARDVRFVVVGDLNSPAEYCLQGCTFHSLEEQGRSGFRYARNCPERSYARKNIGYLLAIRDGARVLMETDDDNFPREAFWKGRPRRLEARCIEDRGWVNVYRYFSDVNIWPRGLPLTEITKELPRFEDVCPIQQGLADENPDVDALYRLILPLPQSFRVDRRLILGPGAWCPFNSQNTTWWDVAFPLLYLPAFCSFRMTDIWRSFVAQRIAWANGWSVLFHEPTVWQERNEHDLLRDFKDEIPGYLLNKIIGEGLSNLHLEQGVDHIHDNLLKCYGVLVELGAVSPDEIPLLEAWLADLAEISRPRAFLSAQAAS